MNVNPRFCHTLDSATPRMADVGSARSMNGTVPMYPTMGFSITKKMTDATATEVATVEANTVWKKRMPRSRRWAATASRTPRMSPAGTVHNTYCRLIHRPLRNSAPPRTSVNWLNPTKRSAVPVRFCWCRPR